MYLLASDFVFQSTVQVIDLPLPLDRFLWDLLESSH
jgi:hypothetical protein